jgi:hypothetical protein
MKTFNFMWGVGRAKYIINYHDGVKKHGDGSDFFDINIFSNKKDFFRRMDELQKEGYKYK